MSLDHVAALKEAMTGLGSPGTHPFNQMVNQRQRQATMEMMQAAGRMGHAPMHPNMLMEVAANLAQQSGLMSQAMQDQMPQMPKAPPSMGGPPPGGGAPMGGPPQGTPPGGPPTGLSSLAPGGPPPNAPPQGAPPALPGTLAAAVQPPGTPPGMNVYPPPPQGGLTSLGVANGPPLR